VTPFFIRCNNRSDVTRARGSPPRSRTGEQLAKLRGEGFLEANITPPQYGEVFGDQTLCEGTQARRRRSFIDEMEACFAGLRVRPD